VLSKSANPQIIAPQSGLGHDGTRLLYGVNMLRCGSKKGVAFRQVRAHSEFTTVTFLKCLAAALAESSGEIFNLRAIGGFL